MRHQIAGVPAKLGLELSSSKSLASKIGADHKSAQLSHVFKHSYPPFSATSRSFSVYTALRASNRIQPSIRRPADFHTLLQSSSSTNTLLLTLCKTSTCTSCSTVTPILESIVKNRPVPSAGDKFGSIAFAELELDSPEQDSGGGRGWSNMYDVGIEYGVNSVPMLIGFGGRRADRVTDRVSDVSRLKDKEWLQSWIDEAMKKGDPHPAEGKGLFARIFGGGA